VKPDAANKFLTPTRQQPHHVAEFEVQNTASISILQGQRPPLHDSLCVAWKLGPNCLKTKLVQRLDMSVCMEQQRRMIRASRGQSPKIMMGEPLQPLQADKHSIYAREGWMLPLITPCVKPTLKVELIQLEIMQHVTKCPHKSVVKAGIDFILGFIYEVEVTPHQPPAKMTRPKRLELLHEL
jgi:hypothetical protein